MTDIAATTDGGLNLPEIDAPGDLTATNSEATTSPSQFIPIDSAVLTPSEPIQASPTLLNDIVDTLMQHPAPKKKIKPRIKAMTPKLFEKICEGIEVTTRSANFVCQQNGTVFNTFWNYKREHPEAEERYARARCTQYESLMDQIHDLEKEQTDAIAAADPKKANAVGNAYKCRIDNLKWIMCKLLPGKYGDRVYQRISDGDGNPLKMALPATVTDVEGKLSELEGKLNLEHN